MCVSAWRVFAGNFCFISLLLEFMRLPTNPEAHFFNLSQTNIYTVMRRDYHSQTLGAWWPLRRSSPLLPPHGPTQNAGVPRFDIAPHPGRYVSDHKQAGGGKSMLISRLFAAAKYHATWYQHRALYTMMLRMYRDVVRCMV